MLNQLIITLASLSSYFIIMICFNLTGMPEHINLFLCCLILSAVFMSFKLQQIFYWSSCVFLLSLVMLMQQFDLVIYTISGLLIGYRLSFIMPSLHQHAEWFVLKQFQPSKPIKHRFHSFKKLRQPNSNHVER